MVFLAAPRSALIISRNDSIRNGTRSAMRDVRARRRAHSAPTSTVLTPGWLALGSVVSMLGSSVEAEAEATVLAADESLGATLTGAGRSLRSRGLLVCAWASSRAGILMVM